MSYQSARNKLTTAYKKFDLVQTSSTIEEGDAKDLRDGLAVFYNAIFELDVFINDLAQEIAPRMEGE